MQLERRQRVMQRSMQLGHCVCDPAKPCPCDLLKERDVCPCAGERLKFGDGPVRLTALVDSAGCASKIDQATLRRVLGGLPSLDDPRVLVGMPAGDDAGVYLLDPQIAGPGTALVQTVNVFTPSVDDPYTFGQIAAANSLSDVYAMGGRPITALSIIGFPVHAVPEAVMRDILRGGIDKMTEAGVPVIGGHSINDPQIKAGFAVTGLVNSGRILTNAAAVAGDRLILTKPIGTGILAFAAQIGRASPGSMETAARSMAALNRRASELMIECGARACTDVTGFGLMGHLGAMAASGRVDAEIVWDEIPLLPGVLQCAKQGIIPGAVERNREWSAGAVDVGEGVDSWMLDLCFDPQTSGGLLIAISEQRASGLLSRLDDEGMVQSTVIGRILGPGSGRISVRRAEKMRLPAADGLAEPPAGRTVPLRGQSEANPSRDFSKQEARAMNCCGDHVESGNVAARPGGAADLQEKFHAFMKSANTPGALDSRTKQAIAIALSALAKCEPCLKMHLKKAHDMGFSSEAIDEAAWMAIAFGGCPTMMFYNAVKKDVLGEPPGPN